jgi:hypothetical protein
MLDTALTLEAINYSTNRTLTLTLTCAGPHATHNACTAIDTHTCTQNHRCCRTLRQSWTLANFACRALTHRLTPSLSSSLTIPNTHLHTRTHTPTPTQMLDTALELDTGKYSINQSPVILYVLRLCVRVEAFMLYLQDDALCAATRGLAGAAARRPAVLQTLAAAQKRMRLKLNKVGKCVVACLFLCLCSTLLGTLCGALSAASTCDAGAADARRRNAAHAHHKVRTMCRRSKLRLPTPDT